jgi:hypothetical protein
LGWILLVNTVWFFLLGELQFMKKTTFYVYNISVFIFIIGAGYHDYNRLKQTLHLTCVVALLMQVIYILVFADAPGRRVLGTFNNPNQLGYWALLVMTCLAFTREREPATLTDLAAMGAGLYVAMVSLSRAAFLSALLLVCVFLLTRRLRGPVLALVVAGAMAGLVSLQLTNGGPLLRAFENEATANIAHRLDSVGEDDNEILKRGYDRILRRPEYIAFGAGEGAFHRLHPDGKSKEFHSSLGNIRMSYGIVGILVFAFLFFVVFAGSPFIAWLYIVPIMLYGITHMGLRFSLFWVFLGVVFARRETDNQIRAGTSKTL